MRADGRRPATLDEAIHESQARSQLRVVDAEPGKVIDGSGDTSGRRPWRQYVAALVDPLQPQLGAEDVLLRCAVAVLPTVDEPRLADEASDDFEEEVVVRTTVPAIDPHQARIDDRSGCTPTQLIGKRRQPDLVALSHRLRTLTACARLVEEPAMVQGAAGEGGGARREDQSHGSECCDGFGAGWRRHSLNDQDRSESTLSQSIQELSANRVGRHLDGSSHAAYVGALSNSGETPEARVHGGQR
jgi:hypothetical protein